MRADGQMDGLADSQADRKTDRHDEANRRLLQFCEHAKTLHIKQFYLFSRYAVTLLCPDILLSTGS
jgi:hypothetical protein